MSAMMMISMVMFVMMMIVLILVDYCQWKMIPVVMRVEVMEEEAAYIPLSCGNQIRRERNDKIDLMFVFAVVVDVVVVIVSTPYRHMHIHNMLTNK